MGEPPPDTDRLIIELYQSEFNRMMTYAAYILKDTGLAETAVQETFLAAVTHAERLSKFDSKPGWLYTVLKNNIKAILRERNQMIMTTISIDDAEEEARVEDTYSVIPASIKATEEYKLLMQFYLGGYTLKELSNMYGISIGATKMRIMRAKAKLRDLLPGGERE